MKDKDVKLSRQEKLELTRREINKSLGCNVVYFAKEEPIKEKCPFNQEQIDKFIGGGTIHGNFTVIYGGESVGKTTLALMQIAQIQKQGKIAAYVNLEHTLSKERAESLGVDWDKLVLIEGDAHYAEQSMDAVRTLSKNKVIDYICIDSIQAFLTKNEQEKSKGKSTTDISIEHNEMAALAKKIDKFIKATKDYVYQAKIAVTLIGQVRTQGIGSFYTHEGLSGGHCFDLDTRIVTSDGIKSKSEIKIGDLIPTVNLEKNCVELMPIKNIIECNTNQIYQFQNKYEKELLFTPKHQMVVKSFDNGSLKTNRLRLMTPDHKYRTYGFPCCFPSGNSDYPITDNELKLLGWLLTDAILQVADKTALNWRKYSNRVLIYQSKPAMIKKIKQLLNDLKIDYTIQKRAKRDNRTEFANTKTSYVFYLSVKNQIPIKYNITNNKEIPSWCFSLSDRQVRVLLDSMMDGNGHRRPTGHYEYYCDGSLKKVEDLSRLCATHNIPTSWITKDKRKNCWYLRFQIADYIGFHRSQKKLISCDNLPVWDIEVDNQIHFVERDGQIIITHNSVKHYAVMILYIRKGQSSDAPKAKVEVISYDGEGNEEVEVKEKAIGFNAVIKIEKTKVTNCAPEGSEISLPFFYKTGFNKELAKKDLPKIEEPKKQEIVESNITKKRGRPKKEV